MRDVRRLIDLFLFSHGYAGNGNDVRDTEKKSYTCTVYFYMYKVPYTDNGFYVVLKCWK